VIGYYKFSSLGNDTAEINASLSKNHVNIGGGGYNFLPSATYKRFSFPIGSATTPDTLRIDIYAGKWPITAAMAGSKLWIDGVQLYSSPLAVPLVFMGAENISTFPNPSNGRFNLIYESNSEKAVELEVLNEVGQIVFTQQLNASGMKNQIDLSGYAKGIYLLKTNQEGVINLKRIIIQ
jgi:hypothetical protein